MVENEPVITAIPTGFAEPVAASLSAAIQRLVETIQPEQIILFGSYAYGRPTADSDVDLLIVLETDAPPVERFARASQALWPRPFPLDLMVLTPAEVQQAVLAGDSPIKEILRRGRVLYERPG